MAGEVRYGSLPFDEAIKFFRQKVNLPTKTWSDLWEGMHARAFVVAGATKAELLADLRGAIDKAISEGTTLETFRKDFDALVGKHGWSYKGERNWRTRVMLETNMTTAYQAGRWEQLTDPESLKHRPFLLYRHGDSLHPRKLHLAWDGKVLAADDPWWRTHYPPNGWGCSCTAFALSRSDLKAMGKDAPDEAPKDGTYRWTNRRTGEVHQVPEGIDPGWGYNVGEAAWGRPQAKQALAEWSKAGPDAWERLTPGSWQTASRPEALPVARAKGKPLPAPKDPAALARSLEKVLGGEEKVYTAAAGKWPTPVLVNAEALSEVVALDDGPLLGLLPSVLEEPQEVWASFEKHKGTGKVALKLRFVKHVAAGGRRAVVVAHGSERGVLEAVSFHDARELNVINGSRQGRLVVQEQ